MGGKEEQTYCLRWNNHKSNLIEILEGLFRHESYVDCTLCVDDGKFFVHRIILAANSAYFQTILQDMPMDHCTVLFPGVKEFEMKPLLDYMYTGEVNITQEQIPHIMQIAVQLGVKGLYDMNDVQDQFSTSKGGTDGSSPPYSFKSSLFDTSAIPSSSNCPLLQWPVCDAADFPLAPDSPPQNSATTVGSIYDTESDMSPLKRKKLHSSKSMLGLSNERDRKEQQNAQSNSAQHTDRKTKYSTSSKPMFPDDMDAAYSYNVAVSQLSSPTNQKPEWKRYKQYTSQNLNDAIQAVKDGMTALQASRRFNVPSRTLYDKVKKMGISGQKPVGRSNRRSSSNNDIPASFPYGLSGVSGTDSPLSHQYDDQPSAMLNELDNATEMGEQERERLASIIDTNLFLKAMEQGNDLSNRDALMALAAANGIQSLSRQSISQATTTQPPLATAQAQSNDKRKQDNQNGKKDLDSAIRRNEVRENDIKDLSIEQLSEQKTELTSPPQSPLSVTSQSESTTPETKSQQSVIDTPIK